MSNYSNSMFHDSDENTSWLKVFNLIPEGATVLDVGCSSGNFGKTLIDKKSCTVDGIELDPKDAETARKKLRNVWNCNIETDDISELSTGQYDVIYFGDVIEHLVDPIHTLERIRPLLSRDGGVLFSIPNMAHIAIRLALLSGDFDYTETGLLDKTHLHFYTQREVVRVFEEAGYSLQELDFVIQDYPQTLIQKQLQKYGLQANSDFYKKMQETDAGAFQFVGKAIPGKRVHHKLETFGPANLFDSFFQDTVKDYEAKLLTSRSTIAELRSDLEKVERLLTYKILHPYRALAGHIKNKFTR